MEHKADATAKYGRRAPYCRYAHVVPPSSDEILQLDLGKYPGGVAMWGSVAPIFDTTNQIIEKGVHVHARKSTNSTKSIDQTYRAIAVQGMKRDLFAENFVVSELPAIYFMVSHVFGFDTAVVICPRCGNLHLDKDWFAVHPHKKHLCEGCGRTFSESTKGIGNPLAWLREKTEANHDTQPSKQPLSLRQADYPGGIQIWGSNPALVWTGLRIEETGIHVHAYADEPGKELVVDDTFRQVEIDGVCLDPVQVRYAMAQSALPHLAGRVTSLSCTSCGVEHFDRGEFAFTPHPNHRCENCGQTMTASGRFRKTISNPMAQSLKQLERYSARERRHHKLGLLVEAP